jgi:6-phosphogluconolactonase
MKALLLLLTLTALAQAGPLVLYVSESGDKRLAVYHLDEATGALERKGAVDLPGSPGSLALSPDHRHLHASIRSTRQAASFTLDPSTGLPGDPVFADLGFNAAYLYVDKTDRWLLAASYSEGVAGVLPLTAGRVGGAPVSVLETGKKAHAIQTSPDNRFAFVPHVGELNKVEQLRFDATTGRLSRNDPPHLPGGSGEGPRHLQFHPNGRWAYFVNEQGRSVTLCDYDAARGTLSPRQSLSTVPNGWTTGSCADLHLTANGRFLYASNRGHDSLALFLVDPATGQLTSQGQAPTEKTPRSFCLTPGDAWVVAAGEGSHTLAVYRRDPQTGGLARVQSVPCGKGPAWILPLRL